MTVNVTVLGQIRTLVHVADSIGRAGWVFRHQIRDGRIGFRLAERKLTARLTPDQIIRLANARRERSFR